MCGKCDSSSGFCKRVERKGLSGKTICPLRGYATDALRMGEGVGEFLGSVLIFVGLLEIADAIRRHE